MEGYIKITPSEPTAEMPEGHYGYFFNMELNCRIGREERCSLLYNLALCLGFTEADWARTLAMAKALGRYSGSVVESIQAPLPPTAREDSK
ncbi:MAG: hypothetical protein J6T26_04955 [Firmicutes bacterium]|nr:hypothetical protein [Bacillota bacterium]